MTSLNRPPAFPFHVKTHAVPSQHVREWPRATANSQEDVLHLSVNQYIPKDNPNPQPGDVTILAAHANGFPKELYEALWCDLHALTTSSSAPFRIRGIWIADVANQGQSGVLNESKLGNDPSWNDHARDLLHLTNVFRAEMPQPMVGVGHSFGGNCLTHLSLLHPRLLTTLVLLDPVIIKFTFAHEGAGITPTRASAFRRDSWPSAAEAEASFRRSPFYRSWDPRVLDAWIAHAIRPTPTALFPSSSSGDSSSSSNTSSTPPPGATLTTTRHQEVFTFFRPLWPHLIQNPDGSVSSSRITAPDFPPPLSDSGATPASLTNLPKFPFYRSEGPTILSRLPHLRPPVLYLFGGESDLSTPEKRQEKLSTTGVGPGGSGGQPEGRVAEIVLEGQGHLFPMELPAVCAQHAFSWIGEEVGVKWKAQQAEYEGWVRSNTLREKSTLGKEFEDRIGRPKPRGGKKKETPDPVAEQKKRESKL